MQSQGTSVGTGESELLCEQHVSLGDKNVLDSEEIPHCEGHQVVLFMRMILCSRNLILL